MPQIDAFCCAFYVEEALHSKLIRKDEIANRQRLIYVTHQTTPLGLCKIADRPWKIARFKLR
jgi:hypothetical protein